MTNKVTIKGADQAVQMFGPAQAAVARAVVDSVKEGVIPKDQVDDLNRQQPAAMLSLTLTFERRGEYPHEQPAADVPLPGSRAPPPNAGDLALVQFSSGSTGEPRGVCLTHANVLSNANTPLFPTMSPKKTIKPTPTSTQTAVPYEPFSPDRLRMVYVENGNIFVRNGFNPPIQLTVSGIDQNPIISTDGEKKVFYRGDGSDTVFSINADGS